MTPTPACCALARTGRNSLRQEIDRHLQRRHARMVQRGVCRFDGVARDAVVADLALPLQRFERVRATRRPPRSRRADCAAGAGRGSRCAGGAGCPRPRASDTRAKNPARARRVRRSASDAGTSRAAGSAGRTSGLMRATSLRCDGSTYPALLAMTTSSRRPRNARPRSCSLSPWLYMSAVSKKLMPPSSAAVNRLTKSPALLLKMPPMRAHPSPSSETWRSVRPNWRTRMPALEGTITARTSRR